MAVSRIAIGKLLEYSLLCPFFCKKINAQNGSKQYVHSV